MRLLTRLSRAQTNPTVVIAVNGFGCLLSMLLLFSGILLYPLIVLILSMLGAAVAALALGAWFGGYRRIPGALALAVGNAAVLIGFACYLVAFSLFGGNSDAFGIVFYAAALVMVFGYSALAGSITRPAFKRWTRSG